MKLKRIAALLAAAALLALTAVPALAAGEKDPVVITVGTVEGVHPGDTVTVPITLTGEGYEVHSVNLDLFYDVSALTVESVAGGELTTSGASCFPYFDYETDPGRVAMVVLALSGSISGSGELLLVTFKVSENCTADQPLTISVREFEYMPIGAASATPVAHTEVSGAILLAGPEPIIGDVNCDGFVTATDISALFSYVMNAGSLSEEAIANADINGDGSVDATDASLLAQMVFGN